MLPGVRVRGPYQRKDGRYQVDVREGDGSRRCRTFTTLADGQDYADELLATVRATNPVTLEEALGEYERAMTTRGLKPGSIASALAHTRRFFPDTGGRLRSLSPSRCKVLYASLAAEKLAQGSHRSYLLSARTFLHWCVAENLIASNPLVGVAAVGRRKYGKAQHRVDELRLWEAEAFRRATSGDEQALAALMALYLGMRATEITLRVVRDVDDGGRILWIPDAKTEAGKRALDVPDVIAPMLVALCKGRDRSAVLFPGYQSRPVHHRDWVRNGVRSICDAAGVPRVSAHAMRGALATLAEERGQLGHLAALHFGHTTPAMTQRAYVAPGVQERAIRGRGLAVLKGGKR
jgi:integrase